MEWHPAAQEDGGSYAGYNKQVQIFGQVEETEVHTAIFGVVSCRQFTFRFRQVERTTVTLCISGYQVDNESDHCRNVSFEDEPSVSLSFYNFRELHRTHQHYHSQYTQSYRQLVRDNLCPASHGSDQ